jgi:hypothetical protein
MQTDEVRRPQIAEQAPAEQRECAGRREALGGEFEQCAEAIGLGRLGARVEGKDIRR